MKTEGEELRDEGIARVQFNNRQWITSMREKAISLARQGSVSADDLRPFAVLLEGKGLYPGHENAWGAIFKTRDFEWVGRRKSVWPGNHARWIMVWKLKEE